MSIVQGQLVVVLPARVCGIVTVARAAGCSVCIRTGDMTTRADVPEDSLEPYTGRCPMCMTGEPVIPGRLLTCSACSHPWPNPSWLYSSDPREDEVQDVFRRLAQLERDIRAAKGGSDAVVTGAHIRSARKAAGLTIHALAAKLDTIPSLLEGIERESYPMMGREGWKRLLEALPGLQRYADDPTLPPVDLEALLVGVRSTLLEQFRCAGILTDRGKEGFAGWFSLTVDFVFRMPDGKAPREVQIVAHLRTTPTEFVELAVPGSSQLLLQPSAHAIATLIFARAWFEAGEPLPSPTTPTLEF